MSHDFSRRRVSQNWSVKKAVVSGTPTSFVSEAGRCTLCYACIFSSLPLVALAIWEGEAWGGENFFFSLFGKTRKNKKKHP